MLYERCSLNATHDSHVLHASRSGVGVRQLIVFAKMRAHVVLPTPRGPLKRYAWANLFPAMAFFSVVVSASCPTTDWNVEGLYFLAETINGSMSESSNQFTNVVKTESRVKLAWTIPLSQMSRTKLA